MGYGSQAEREFSWYLKGPLKAWEMALRLKTHTAEAAMLFLGGRGRERGAGQTAPEDAARSRLLPMTSRSPSPNTPRAKLRQRRECLCGSFVEAPAFRGGSKTV